MSVTIHHLAEVLYPVANSLWMAAIVFGYLEEKCGAVFDRFAQKQIYQQYHRADAFKTRVIHPMMIFYELQRSWAYDQIKKWIGYPFKMTIEQVNDYKDLVKGMLNQLFDPEVNYTCLIDEHHVIQGVSSFFFKDNPLSYACITRLIIAPWNLHKSTRQVKGVGSALIENICYQLFARQGIDSDKPLSYSLIKATKIELGPNDTAFYRHLFFENVDQQWPPHTMVLEGENLLTFLRAFGGR